MNLTRQNCWKVSNIWFKWKWFMKTIKNKRIVATSILNRRILLQYAWNKHTKKSEHIRLLNWSLPEKEFKQVVRIYWDNFVQIVHKLCTYRMFCNNSKNWQPDIWIQALVAFFERLGTDGNGASVGCIARGSGISNDSVTLYALIN
jgi:uncharacterized protein (DUF608 family)